jgi:N-acetylneuraminate synthase
LKLEKPKIIAEVGQAHEGSDSLAHSFIDEAAESGADAVKFQLHIADVESCVEDDFRARHSYSRETRFEYWKRHEFSPSMISDLVDHSRARGLEIGFSTFSLEGLDILKNASIDFLKIGSAEALQPWFLERAKVFEGPIILSTGLSAMEEIARSVEILRAPDRDLILLQCTTKYPSLEQDIGINVMQQFRESFRLPVGLSDHSGSLFAPVLAMALGANYLEVHVTFSKHMQGPDSLSSLTFQELSELCKYRDSFFEILSSPVSKNTMADTLSPMREIFGRSISYRRGLEAGHVVQESDLYFSKPGGGIKPERLGEITGKVLRVSTKGHSIVKPGDFI